jgi:hypothetical protein
MCRVLPDLSLENLREEMTSQLEPDSFPANFIFVRNVGRHFTTVSELPKPSTRYPPQAVDKLNLSSYGLANPTPDTHQAVETPNYSVG